MDRWVFSLARLRGATNATLRLKGVSGFYSDWSPSNRTDEIKVLANKSDQRLENPENLRIDPPVLGNVQEFELSFSQKYSLAESVVAEEELDDEAAALPPALTTASANSEAVGLAMQTQFARID